MSTLTQLVGVQEIPFLADKEYSSISDLYGVTVGTEILLVVNGGGPLYVYEGAASPTSDDDSIMLYGPETDQNQSEVTNDPEEIWVRNAGFFKTRLAVYTME